MTYPHPDEQPAVEPIAIIGLACRVPGAADARQFWRNLADGVEAIRHYTREEQLALGVPEHVVSDPNFVPAAMALDDYDAFDAPFFGMSAREAEIRDPQHRLFLELAHTALEDAGYDPARYPGEIGVYAGVGPDAYQWEIIRKNPKAYATAGWLAVMIGNHPDYCATLTSYRLDLRGPSVTMHTACSTSLVAAHVACEALRNGECDLALTGGATIDVTAGRGYIYDEGGINSPDGHCRAFDAEGKGTIFSSGGGVILLKRLSDALAEGDHVRAVIRGNAINNDGATKAGFSAPSMEGQAAVIEQALGVAGVDPRTVTYIEAHGTGTSLGDPIEVSALASVFERETDDRGWCGIGSVKTNIGHLGQSAGVVSVIKAVLALEHGLIPPSLNYETPNPKIDFGRNPFYVNNTLAKWESDGFPRRAGVSSFGIGGTNSHVVLEEAPGRPPAPHEPRPAHLLQVSARTDTALRAAVDRLAGHLTEHPELDLADVAHTLRVGRRQLARRAAVVAGDPVDAAAALADARRLVTGVAARRAPRVALLFSGQGAQYAGMGAGLYSGEAVFRDAVDECAEILRPGLGEDVRDLMLAGGDDAADERLRHTALTQPALFTIEYALARLWQSWGLEPAGMIGHSIGEYVAATLAGVFTPADALRLVAARGRLMQSLPPGSMLAVQLDEAEVRERLPDGVSVATVNGPGACVVAGPADAVAPFADEVSAAGVGTTALRTSHAFHSPMMDPILAEFTELVAATERSAPRLPFLSNVTGAWITPDDATDPAYWARHLRAAVRFGDCVSTLLAEGDWLLVECGPGRQLAGLARLQLPRDAFAPLPSLPGPRDQSPDLHTLYAAAGTLWSNGVSLDGFGAPGRRVALPTYPWERKRMWIEPDPAAALAATHLDVTEGPVPRPVDKWFAVPVWRQLPTSPAPAPTITRCLAFLDDDAAGLGAALRATGADVVEVRPGEEYRRDPSGGYVVRPAERGDYDSLVADLAAADGIPPRVVHAWTVGRRGPAWAAQNHGFFSLLWLVQALTASGHGEPVHVDVVTSGTQDVVGGDLTSPEHATVAGIARVIPLEVPSLTVRHVDLDDSATDWAGAAEELHRPPGDGSVARRAGRRWVQDYEPVTVPATEPAGPREGSVYVITGGLGGIGITVAEDLARRARARLVLLSRSGLTGDRSGRAIAAVKRMEDAGADVMVLAADVTSVADLRRVRDETLARFGRVDGIVHAAGVPGGGMAEVKERAAAEQVMAPKLLGVLALQEAFGDLDLDTVVLCSSITAVAGGFGQVDYCAANNFLDAYARSAHGWRARVVSVNWGGWREVGMAANAAAPEGFRALQRGEPVVTRVEHPVLTERRAAPGDALASCAGMVSPETHWVLDQHRMPPAAVMPGTGYVEIARCAAEAVLPDRADGKVIELRDLAFVEPLAVPDGASAEVLVVFTPEPDGADFQLTSRAGGTTRTHVRGSAGWIDAGPAPVVDLAAIRERCAQAGGQGGVALTGLLSYGPHWANLRTWQRGDNEALALLEANDVVAADLDRWVLHPGMLDEATSFARFIVDGHYLPLSYGRVVVRGAMPPRMWSHLRFRESGAAGVIVVDGSLYDDSGQEVVAVSDYVLRRVDADAVLASITATPALPDAPADPNDVANTPREPARGIRPADGAEAFRRLLANRLGAQVVVTEEPLAELIANAQAVTQEAIESELDSADAADKPAPSQRDGYVAPQGELEAAVARLFGAVLGDEEIGADDDFFELGGNSLVAVQLIALIRKEMAVRLPMRSLFEAPTVAGVAALVEEAQRSGEAASPTIPRLPRQSGQQG